MCCIVLGSIIGGVAVLYAGSLAIDWLANIWIAPKDRR